MSDKIGAPSAYRLPIWSRLTTLVSATSAARAASIRSEAALQKIVHLSGATIGSRIADIVRQAVIDLDFDVGEPAERFVIADRADRLAARDDDESRGADPRHLVAPIVARHQENEPGDISGIVVCRLVEKPFDEAGIG